MQTRTILMQWHNGLRDCMIKNVFVKELLGLSLFCGLTERFVDTSFIWMSKKMGRKSTFSDISVRYLEEPDLLQNNNVWWSDLCLPVRPRNKMPKSSVENCSVSEQKRAQTPESCWCTFYIRGIICYESVPLKQSVRHSYFRWRNFYCSWFLEKEQIFGQTTGFCIITMRRPKRHFSVKRCLANRHTFFGTSILLAWF